MEGRQPIEDNYLEYLGYINFENDGSYLSDGTPTSGMIKLPGSFDISTIYGLRNSKMEIPSNGHKYALTLYYQDTWQYPNTEYPEISAGTKIYDDSIKDFNKEDYQPYVEATATVLPVTEHQAYPILERTGELLHYKYNDSDTIHIPLVSGTVEDIAKKCGLTGSEKYIHLTNLIYHKE